MSNQTPGNPFGFLPDDTGIVGNNREEPLGLLGGKYMVLEVRRGGMGEVYICESTSEDNLRVALKTFQKRLFFDRASREAFVREVSIWIRLTGQPHILPAIGLEQFNGRPFVVMLAVKPGPSGEVTVRDLLEQRRGGLSPEKALSLAFQMAHGLQSAQKCVPGIVHGDLKPENLLLIGEQLFISDFAWRVF
jgi:serine/threonine protein kinase